MNTVHVAMICALVALFFAPTTQAGQPRIQCQAALTGYDRVEEGLKQAIDSLYGRQKLTVYLRIPASGSEVAEMIRSDAPKYKVEIIEISKVENGFYSVVLRGTKRPLANLLSYFEATERLEGRRLLEWAATSELAKQLQKLTEQVNRQLVATGSSVQVGDGPGQIPLRTVLESAYRALVARTPIDIGFDSVPGKLALIKLFIEDSAQYEVMKRALQGLERFGVQYQVLAATKDVPKTSLDATSLPASKGFRVSPEVMARALESVRQRMAVATMSYEEFFGALSLAIHTPEAWDYLAPDMSKIGPELTKLMGDHAAGGVGNDATASVVLTFEFYTLSPKTLHELLGTLPSDTFLGLNKNGHAVEIYKSLTLQEISFLSRLRGVVSIERR